MSEPKTDEGLISFGDLLSRIKNRQVVKPVKPVKTQSWQELALEIIKFTNATDKSQISSIFKYCKTDQQKAQIAFSDCKELRKPYPLYFLKVFSVLKSHKTGYNERKSQ
jgi:hypothetical protein